MAYDTKVTGFCPRGGDFYVCQGNTTEFLGCCTKDPCADGSGNCPTTSIRYTSYNADQYDDIPPEACASSGDWYTCSFITTAFMGCCLENPCQNDGCTQGNLTAARLSDNADQAAPFLASTAATTASSSPSSSTTTTTTSSSPSSSSSSSSGTSKLSTGAIVGIAIGVSLGALIVGILLFFFYKRHERRRAWRKDELRQAIPHGPNDMHMPPFYHG